MPLPGLAVQFVTWILGHSALTGVGFLRLGGWRAAVFTVSYPLLQLNSFVLFALLVMPGAV